MHGNRSTINKLHFITDAQKGMSCVELAKKYHISHMTASNYRLEWIEGWKPPIPKTKIGKDVYLSAMKKGMETKQMIKTFKVSRRTLTRYKQRWCH